MTDTKYDCVIVGGGPAGLTAAIYLQRFRRKTLVVDQGNSRVKMAPRIRNLIGYDAGIPGKDLLQRLKRQATKFNAHFVEGEAEVRRHSGGFTVQVNEKIFHSRFVILAIGMKDKQPAGIDFVDLCRRKYLAYCPICDGFEQCEKEIGVLINNRAGLRKAKFLHHYSKKLRVILIQDIKLEKKILGEMKSLGIKVHQGELQILKADPLRQKLIVKLKGAKPFALDMAYVELGLKVPSHAVRRLRGLRRVNGGRFEISRRQQTSIPGLYAIGDCANSLAQVTVATGEGAVAATDIHNKLLAQS